MLKVSKVTRRALLFFCLMAIFCFSPETVNAQSGRRNGQKTKPAEQTKPTEQTMPTEQITPADPETVLTLEDDETEDKTPVQIKSLKIVGEVQHDARFYRSNEMDNAIKEFIRTLKLYSKPAPVMTRGGKATYAEAKELAKKESDTFILWIGFMAKTDGYGNMYIDVVQYAVIKPQTGKILTRAEIRPAQTQMISPGVILPAPNVRRTSPVRMRQEMNDIVRKIAAILARAGWLN